MSVLGQRSVNGGPYRVVKSHFASAKAIRYLWAAAQFQRLKGGQVKFSWKAAPKVFISRKSTPLPAGGQDAQTSYGAPLTAA